MQYKGRFASLIVPAMHASKSNLSTDTTDYKIQVRCVTKQNDFQAETQFIIAADLPALSHLQSKTSKTYIKVIYLLRRLMDWHYVAYN